VDAAADKPVAPWVKLLGPLCRYDTVALRRMAADHADAPLATYLAFLTLDNAGSAPIAIEAADEALEQSPECLRVIDGQSAHAGIILMHRTSTMGWEALAKIAPRDVKALPEIPETVKQAADLAAATPPDPAAHGALVSALIEAGAPGKDSGEPSLAVLGWMIRDAHFMNCFRQVAFWSGLGGEMSAAQQRIDTFKPLLGDHRHLPLMRAHLGLSEADETAVMQTLPTAEICAGMFPALFRLGANQIGDSNFFAWITLHRDHAARDYERVVVGGIDAKFYGTMAKRGLDVSPHNPVLMAKLVGVDWEFAAPRAAAWESEQGKFPVLAQALGRRYLLLERYDDSQRCWEKCLRAWPDADGYIGLAEVYLARGDEAKWLATMEKCLQLPDYQLMHGEVSYFIARHYMDSGEFQKALPYAEAAAGTGSEWGTHCLANCRGGLGNWQQAEQMVRSASAAYGNPSTPYYWCLEQGHGDLDAARAEQKKVIASGGSSNYAVAYFALFEGNPKSAIEVMRKFVDSAQYRSKESLHLALLLDGANDAPARDAALSELVQRRDRLNSRDKIGADIAKLWISFLAGGAAATID
ncbi:MAG: tetratricopeptide repeat protein, partial [Tepidisphaeraceae bacterium]